MLQNQKNDMLSRKRKWGMLQISNAFDTFGSAMKVNELVKQTKFSRKKVWNLLKIMEKAGGVQQVKKGLYKPIYPRLNELRVKWGGEVRRFTIDEFIDLLKKGEIHLLKEEKENPATLWLYHLDISSEISNLQEEQKMLDWIKTRVYEALKESKNPSKLRAYAIFGCLYWEEEKSHTAELEKIQKK